MNVAKKNEITKEALGIVEIEFRFYRAGRTHWRVYLNDGTHLNLALPNLATESTVLRAAAEKLAKQSRAITYPRVKPAC